ncbi:MAG: hypothetical protein KGJ86_07310 [Chloroflexota bacterium]|nr:hypothetical protein [Chloroflexota bacterium]
MADLPLAVIPHPLADQPADVVKAKGEGVVDAIVHILSTPAEQLSSEERSREYAEPKSIFRSKTIFA